MYPERGGQAGCQFSKVIVLTDLVIPNVAREAQASNRLKISRYTSFTDTYLLQTYIFYRRVSYRHVSHKAYMSESYIS
jgi:hypothetical protein